jgi:hypothetical protein
MTFLLSVVRPDLAGDLIWVCRVATDAKDESGGSREFSHGAQAAVRTATKSCALAEPKLADGYAFDKP